MKPLLLPDCLVEWLMLESLDSEVFVFVDFRLKAENFFSLDRNVHTLNSNLPESKCYGNYHLSNNVSTNYKN